MLIFESYEKRIGSYSLSISASVPRSDMSQGS